MELASVSVKKIVVRSQRACLAMIKAINQLHSLCYSQIGSQLHPLHYCRQSLEAYIETQKRYNEPLYSNRTTNPSDPCFPIHNNNAQFSQPVRIIALLVFQDLLKCRICRKCMYQLLILKLAIGESHYYVILLLIKKN